MSKVWHAVFTSFKGKHPEGEKVIDVVVKSKMKKDAIELAKKELALFDKHHDAYKAPALTEITDEEQAERMFYEYFSVREKVSQTDIDDIAIETTTVETKVSALIEAVKNHDQFGELLADERESLIAAVSKNISALSSDIEKFNLWGAATSAISSQISILRLADLAHCKNLFGPQRSWSYTCGITTSEEQPEAVTFSEVPATFDSAVATVAEFKIIEPYAVRIAIAKSEEKFVCSMVIVNRNTGGNCVGQQGIFYTKKFNDADNCIVYGLAMAIDAVNSHLNGFLNEKQIEVCSSILSGFAQDAEGNFTERFINNLDLQDASFMAITKPAAEKCAVDLVMQAITNHRSYAALVDSYQYPKENLVAHVSGHWKYLEKKHGALPVQNLIEHIEGMADISDLVNLEACDEILSHYITGTTTTEIEHLTKPVRVNPKETCHYGRSILKSVNDLEDFETRITQKELNQMAENLRAVFLEFTKQYGNGVMCGRTVEKMEKDHNWPNFEFAYETFMHRDSLKAVIRRDWLTLDSAVVQEMNAELPETPEPKHYAGTCWQSYAAEVLEQFDTALIDYAAIDAPAKNLASLFNDWKVALFADRDHRTVEADIFRDEVFLSLPGSAHTADAFELLCDRQKSEEILIRVLADSYQEMEIKNSYVQQRLDFLVGELSTDISHGCILPVSTIKALIYSEISLMSDELINETLKTDAGIMQWFLNLANDYKKLCDARYGVEEECEPQTGKEIEETSPEFTTDTAESEFVDSVPLNAEEIENVIVTHPETVAAPEIVPDAIEAKKPYCVYLDENRDTANPYEVAVLDMLQATPDGIQFDLDQDDFELMALNLQQAIDAYDKHAHPIKKGETVVALIKGAFGESGKAIYEILMSNHQFSTGISDLITRFAVHAEEQPQEGAQDEPETTRQDFEHSGDDSITDTDNRAPAAADGLETAITPQTHEQNLNLRTLAMQLMRKATINFGSVGFGWGYEIKRQWINKKAGECHIELGIWFKDEKRGKGDSMSFFGVSSTSAGNYVNDAMLLALANGLEMTLFSLGVTLEE